MKLLTPLSKLSFIAIICFSLITISSNLRADQVDSLSVIPTNPTANDVVQLILHTQFSSGGCWVDSFTVSISGGYINVFAYYSTGSLAVICTRTDTFTIGKLAAGAYQLVGNQFTGSAWQDTGSVNFTVTPMTGIDDPDIYSSRLNTIFPNPAGQSMSMNYALPNGNLTGNLVIFDLHGRQLLDQTLNGNSGAIQIQRSGLVEGMYFYAIRTEAGMLEVRKLIVH
ncbi:MAG: T9SS type A sorting domain-containing protein [Bacteroidetes bacterium]|nr:T9SS type A sorting domain-containing protein [Bacteroidota bacterium]